MVSCFTVQSASCIFNVVVGTMADIAVVISSTTPISMGLSASCDIELLILAGQLYPAAMVTQFFVERRRRVRKPSVCFSSLRDFF
jgi:hypothetical protein